jgi:hypothetical protein
MAKLSSIIQYNGSLDGLTAYNLEGVEGKVVRMQGGPTKEQVQHASEFVNTRKNNKETAGRSVATGFIMAAFGGLRPAADQSCGGRLNALLIPAQEMDTTSEWGQRHMHLSATPRLLEGFTLRKVYPLEGVLHNPVYSTVDKTTASAIVDVPAILPGANFSVPKGLPFCRLVAVLGVVPDLWYTPAFDHYFPHPQFTPVMAQTVYGDWFPALEGTLATSLSLTLPQVPAVNGYSLLLTFGVQWGTVGAGGSVKLNRKVKSARIERVV